MKRLVVNVTVIRCLVVMMKDLPPKSSTPTKSVEQPEISIAKRGAVHPQYDVGDLSWSPKLRQCFVFESQKFSSLCAVIPLLRRLSLQTR